jgi:hypothetical protein
MQLHTEAIKLLQDWSKWLVGIDSAAIAALAALRGDARNFNFALFATSAYTFFSCLVAIRGGGFFCSTKSKSALFWRAIWIETAALFAKSNYNSNLFASLISRGVFEDWLDLWLYYEVRAYED